MRPLTGSKPFLVGQSRFHSPKVNGDGIHRALVDRAARMTSYTAWSPRRSQPFGSTWPLRRSSFPKSKFGRLQYSPFPVTDLSAWNMSAESAQGSHAAGLDTSGEVGRHHGLLSPEEVTALVNNHFLRPCLPAHSVAACFVHFNVTIHLFSLHETRNLGAICLLRSRKLRSSGQLIHAGERRLPGE